MVEPISIISIFETPPISAALISLAPASVNDNVSVPAPPSTVSVPPETSKLASAATTNAFIAAWSHDRTKVDSSRSSG